MLFNTRVNLNPLADPTLILFMIALAIGVTVLSGSYPGLILSGFKPVAALKGKLSAQVKGNFNLRRGLNNGSIYHRTGFVDRSNRYRVSIGLFQTNRYGI